MHLKYFDLKPFDFHKRDNFLAVKATMNSLEFILFQSDGHTSVACKNKLETSQPS